MQGATTRRAVWQLRKECSCLQAARPVVVPSASKKSFRPAGCGFSNFKKFEKPVLLNAQGVRKEAPPVAESSDRSGWAGTCLCTNEVQGKGLVPTRILTPCTQKVNCPERAREAGLGHSPLLSHQTLLHSFSTTWARPVVVPYISTFRSPRCIQKCMSLRGGQRPTWQSVLSAGASALQHAGG